MVVFPALASLCKRLAGNLVGRAMEEAPLDMVVGATGCPMLATVVEATTRPLSSVVRGSSTRSFFLESSEVRNSTSLCQ